MAVTPTPELTFTDSCRDCGSRSVDLPIALPEIGDDFDWLVRDYDGFRMFMMEELAGRFPERTRWTTADIEVVLVEALAVVLDQFSDTLDRAHNEAFLDSARRPQSIRRLLKLIGYDAVLHHYTPKWSSEEVVFHLLNLKEFDTSSIDFSLNLTVRKHLQKLLVWLGHPENILGEQPSLKDKATEHDFLDLIGYDTSSLAETLDLDIAEHRLFATEQLERQWRDNVFDMQLAKTEGPRKLHTNYRMVTLDDYLERIEDHPMVLRAAAKQKWTGSWNTILASCVLFDNAKLDERVNTVVTGLTLNTLQQQVDSFHNINKIAPVDWNDEVTFRSVVKGLVDQMRMAGQEVWLQNSLTIGISISLSIRIANNYFQTEISQAVTKAMANEVGGFFEPGRLAFGNDLYASDLIDWLMNIEGVDAVCLNRFKRVGSRYAEQSGSGVISIGVQEIARCDNDLQQPEYGYWNLSLHGGQKG